MYTDQFKLFGNTIPSLNFSLDKARKINDMDIITF